MKKLVILGLFSMLATTGCTVTSSSSGDGTLELDWTIDESTSASGCATYGADHVEVNVDGTMYTAACEDMSISITLPAGTYDTATIWLDDVNGTQITTTGAISDFDITDGDTTDASFDFPADTFTN